MGLTCPHDGVLPRGSTFAWLYLFGFGSREKISPEISWEQCVISYPDLPRREWDLGTRLNNVYLNINYFLCDNSVCPVLKRFQLQPRFHGVFLKFLPFLLLIFGKGERAKRVWRMSAFSTWPEPITLKGSTLKIPCRCVHTLIANAR